MIDEWLLLEYAFCYLPANQDALVESVSKAGLDLPADFLQAIGVDPSLIVPKHAPLAAIPFTPLAEVEKAVQQRLAAIDVQALVRHAEAIWGEADRRALVWQLVMWRPRTIIPREKNASP